MDENSTIKNFLIVQKEGYREVSRNVVHYNLQMIIAIGFKVVNERAVQFRKWANQIVKDYTIKGWVMNDELLKNGGAILSGQKRLHYAVSGNTAAEMPKLHAETEFDYPKSNY